MQAFPLTFKDGRAFIDLGTTISGPVTALQSALVNTLCDTGSDKIFPTRGSTIQADAAKGRLISLQEARYAANFAALDTMSFMRQVNPNLELEELTLAPVSFENQRLRLDYRGKSNGAEILFNASIHLRTPTR